MLLNWNTRDVCFLSSAVYIGTPFTFVLTCLASSRLVISLEFVRRLQRISDRYLRAKKIALLEREHEITEEMEEKLLLSTGKISLSTKERKFIIAWE